MPSSKEPRHSHVRVVALGAVVALILGGFTAGAILLPSACPGGSHESGTVCLSNATHIAPSSGVRIPVYSVARDSRLDLRVGLALVGILLAGGLAISRRAGPAGDSRGGAEASVA